VFDVVVKILKEFHPSGLLACDFLWFFEVLQVLVVCMDAYGVLRTQEVLSPTFETKDHTCQFFIMGIIVLLSREEALRVE